LLTKTNRLFKSLLKGTKHGSGRSSFTGHITVRHKGSGCKKLFRILNYTNKNYTAILLTVFYDPFRNTFISLNYDFEKNTFFQTIITELVLAGSILRCQDLSADFQLGYRMPLKYIPAGSFIHSLSINSTEKTQFIRAAGTSGQIVQKVGKFCKIKMPSGQHFTVNLASYATIGSVGNKEANLVVIGKAGRNRLCGIRPTVRGVAMNPVDHPHGGRTNGGRPSVTPWGIPTKGKPTVKKKI